MEQFLLRFVAAGLLVATLPWVAGRFGPNVAGLLLLFPVVTLSGLAVLGLHGGVLVVAEASRAALTAVPAVLLFLVAVHIAARWALPVPVVLAVGVTAWLLAASIALALTSLMGGWQ